jgi:hypothetical protein
MDFRAVFLKSEAVFRKLQGLRSLDLQAAQGAAALAQITDKVWLLRDLLLDFGAYVNEFRYFYKYEKGSKRRDIGVTGKHQRVTLAGDLLGESLRKVGGD